MKEEKQNCKLRLHTPSGNVDLDVFDKPFHPVRVISKNEYATRYIVDIYEICVATDSEDDKKLQQLIGQEVKIEITALEQKEEK